MKILNGKDIDKTIHFGKGGEDYISKGTSLWEVLVCIDTHKVNAPDIHNWIFDNEEDARRLLDHIKNDWDNPPLGDSQCDYAYVKEVIIYTRKENKTDE